MPAGDRRSLVVAGAIVALVAVAAVPALGANPSPSPAPSATSKPDKAIKPAGSKAPEISVTVTGTVRQVTDGQGRPTFSLTAGGTTYELSAGPPWYWGDDNPLKASVGKSVTVTGTHREGSTEIDVDTVDGKAIRADGKPPWAGGPWVVGKIHPGWKPWMADGKPGNGHGRANAPGQTKDDGTPDD